MLRDQNMEASPVVRDARGRVTKGSKLSPYGSMPRRQIMAVKRLEGLTEKAIKTLERLLDDPNGSVALGSAREILDRNLGKVKQNVQVDVKHTSVMHLEALQELAERRRAQLLEAQAIDITPHSVSHNANATLDGKGLHEDSALTLSASDYSATVEGPRPPEAPGAAAYAPPTPATPQNSTPPTPQNPTPPQDETP